MGLLDQLLLGNMGGAGFPAYVPPISDESAAVDDAPEAAAIRPQRVAGLLNKNRFSGGSFNDQPPSTNDPASGEPQLFQNGVPVPKPRPIIPSETGGPTDLSSVSKMQSEDAAGRPAAAPAVTPQTMPAAAPDAGEFPKPRAGMFGSLFGGVLRPENAPLFMSLAGGFAGAPSIGTGMRRAFSGATPAAMQLQTIQKQEISQASTYHALIAKGVPPREAMAAVLDPNVMKAVAGKYFETKPRQHATIKDTFGNEVPVSFDQNTGKYYDVGGREMGSMSAGSDTVDALIARGANPTEARAAMRDPDLRKALVTKYFDTKPLAHLTITNALGNQVPISFSPATGKYFDAGGKELNSESLSSGGQDIYKALIAAGAPDAEAKAAVANPEIMKSVAMRYLGTKPPIIHDLTDAMGNKTPVVFDPSANQGKGAFRDMAGKPIGDAASVSGGGTQVLAPGVKYNSALPAEDYFDQFSDDMKAAMKSYLKGETQPSNPRMQNIWNIAKMYAKTYADKAGLDASDQTYQERLTHQREMASGKAGVGMQRTALRQGLEHLEGATKQAIELGNYGLGLAPLSEGVNAIRGLTDSQKGKVTAFDNKIQTLAGEIGKFFSSAQGGGVHERELTRNRFKGITAPNVLADAIDSTLELMEGGLHSREQAQQQLFSGDVPKKVQYMTPDDHARIERIRALSQQLRSGAAGSSPAAAPGGTAGPRKLEWSIER